MNQNLPLTSAEATSWLFAAGAGVDVSLLDEDKEVNVLRDLQFDLFALGVVLVVLVVVVVVFLVEVVAVVRG